MPLDGESMSVCISFVGRGYISFAHHTSHLDCLTDQRDLPSDRASVSLTTYQTTFFFRQTSCKGSIRLRPACQAMPSSNAVWLISSPLSPSADAAEMYEDISARLDPSMQPDYSSLSTGDAASTSRAAMRKITGRTLACVGRVEWGDFKVSVCKASQVGHTAV